MTPGAILKQAKQGDTGAIAIFLNHQLGNPSVKVRTRVKDAHLEILLETDADQDPQDFKAVIQGAIAELAPASIHLVKLYGKRLAEPKPDWSYEFSLEHWDDPEWPSWVPEPSAVTPDFSQAMTRQGGPKGQFRKPPAASQNTIHPAAAPRQRATPNRTLIITLVVLLLQAIVIAALVFGIKQQPRPAATALSIQTPVAATTAEIALAQHLTKIGAKMYGTYWCGVCRAQYDLFGDQAFGQLNYIECDPAGPNARQDLCTQAGIRAYPTWEIAGQLYRGGYPLEALADASGYQGPRNFVNPNPW